MISQFYRPIQFLISAYKLIDFSRVQLNKFKQEKIQRVEELKDLQAVEQVLCDQLCSIPYYIPSNTIPSREQLEELQVG